MLPQMLSLTWSHLIITLSLVSVQYYANFLDGGRQNIEWIASFTSLFKSHLPNESSFRQPHLKPWPFFTLRCPLCLPINQLLVNYLVYYLSPSMRISSPWWQEALANLLTATSLVQRREYPIHSRAQHIVTDWMNECMHSCFLVSS